MAEFLGNFMLPMVAFGLMYAFKVFAHHRWEQSHKWPNR